MKAIKILVVSDSHGNTVALQRIIDREAPFDYLVHCGDGAGDLARVSIPGTPAVVMVQGNIDRARGLNAGTRETIVTGRAKILVTHGDLQGVHHDYLGLLDDAKAGGYAAVLFGHTHRKYLSPGPPALFNPGPAQGGQYGIILAGDTLGFYHRVLKELTA